MVESSPSADGKSADKPVPAERAADATPAVDPLDRLLADPKPWFTSGSIAFLEDAVRPDDLVLEFGGGVSSLWWANKAAFTYTVEADAKWGARLLSEMHKRPELLAKWSLLLAPCEWHTSPDNPKQYWRRHGRHLSAERVSRLQSMYLWMNLAFDPTIIVVDGSVRPQSLDVTSRHVLRKPVRLIVVDNMEVMARHTEGRFPGYERHDFDESDPSLIPAHQNGRWTTSVFVRREAASTADQDRVPRIDDATDVDAVADRISAVLRRQIPGLEVASSLTVDLLGRYEEVTRSSRTLEAKVKLRDQRIRDLSLTNDLPVFDRRQLATVGRCPVCDGDDLRFLPYPDREDDQFSTTHLAGCTRCGLSWLPGRPIDLNVYYHEKYSENVQLNRRSDPAAFFESGVPEVLKARGARIRDLVAAHCPDAKSALDFGAGLGLNLSSLGDHVEKQAVEIDPNCLPFLAHLEIPVVDSLDAIDRRFDVVIATHVLEHLHADEVIEMVDRLAGRLNDGGLMIVEVPGASLLSHVVVEKHAPHTLFFSPDALLRLLSRDGLEVIETTHVDGRLYQPLKSAHYSPPDDLADLTARSPLVVTLRKSARTAAEPPET